MDSASIILKFVRPKISFSTSSEWRVPDIITRMLFCSRSSESFWARLIEIIVTMIGSSGVFERELNSPFCSWNEGCCFIEM